MKKIVICGGHLTPALALIEALAKKDYQIVFFGRKIATDGSPNLSAEYREITRRNIRFVDIIAGRFTRKLTKYTLPSLLKIPPGFFMSLLYLLKERPNLIVSFGGYLSTPVVIGGWLLGIDSISHEQAAVPGLAARVNSLFVKKIFLTWPETQSYFPREKSLVIGNPQPLSLSRETSLDKKIRTFLAKKGDLILVTGGSQGSHVINSFVFGNLDLFAKFLIFHQIGTADYRNDHAKAAKIKKANYFAVDYVSPGDFGAVFKRAKFVISRAGANTVWDLAAQAKPAILIPLPISASGEQMANAEVLESVGSVIIINQQDLSRQTMKDAIEQLEKGLKEFAKNAQVFQKTLPQNPTEKLIQHLTSSLNSNL